MEKEKLPCDIHGEQIKTLFKKIEKYENKEAFIYKLDKSMAIQTELLKQIDEHNKTQDERMKEQDKVTKEQHEVIVNINNNLTELNKGQKVLNERVGKLEDKVDNVESKDKISILNTLNLAFTKFILPVGFIGGIVYFISKLK